MGNCELIFVGGALNCHLEISKFKPSGAYMLQLQVRSLAMAMASLLQSPVQRSDKNRPLTNLKVRGESLNSSCRRAFRDFFICLLPTLNHFLFNCRKNFFLKHLVLRRYVFLRFWGLGDWGLLHIPSLSTRWRIPWRSQLSNLVMLGCKSPKERGGPDPFQMAILNGRTPWVFKESRNGA